MNVDAEVTDVVGANRLAVTKGWTILVHTWNLAHEERDRTVHVGAPLIRQQHCVM